MSEEYEKEFCVLLRSLREKRQQQRRWGKKWTQDAVAKRLGVSRVTYNQWENGMAVPTRYHLKKIVSVFYLDEKEEAALYRAAGQAPPEIHNLPPRNPLFTGRKKYLDELHRHLQEKGSIALTQSIGISGLGGIGKTQLALEYAHRHHPEVYRTVLWVNAANRTTLQASYDSLAHLLNLPEKDEREPGLRVEAVKRWLDEHILWLLIMDNADDLQLARSFMPGKLLGHIILTTRSQAIQDSNIAAQIDIEEMELEEGRIFLLRRAGLLKDGTKLARVAADISTAATALVTLLGRHPLALDQAGAYIDAAGMPLADYLQLYQEKRDLLLDTRGPPRDAPGDHPETVTVTVQLSVKKACEVHSSAADVLYFCSFLQPDAMPEEVFYQDSEMRLTLRSFNDIMVALRRYSLVERNAQEKLLSMHRLVQAVLSDGIPPEFRRQWRERVLQAVNACFPEVDFKDWRQCARLASHALVCASWVEQERYFTSEASALLNKTTTYLIEQGQYSDAEPILMHELLTRQRLWGEEHRDIADTLNNLGSLYRRQGIYDKAESFYLRALTMREKLFGPEHPDTARSLNNLAIVYQIQKKYEQAEPLYQRAIAIHEQRLGPDHPDVARILNNLAILYKDHGKYEEAELVYQRTIAIYEQRLGTEHPDLARTLYNLANLYQYQGKYEQTERLFRRALSIRVKHLEKDHPDTARSLYELAKLLRYRGRYEQVEDMYLRALSIREQKLGRMHPDTKETREEYAKFLREMGRNAEAEALELNDEPSV